MKSRQGWTVGNRRGHVHTAEGYGSRDQVARKRRARLGEAAYRLAASRLAANGEAGATAVALEVAAYLEARADHG